MSVFFAILAVIGFVVFVMGAANVKAHPDESVYGFMRLGGSVVGVLFFILAVNPVVIIPSGTHGLRFTWGSVSKNELYQGIHFKVPFMQEVRTLSMRPHEDAFSIPVNKDGAITRDNQTIGAEIKFFYAYKEGQLSNLWTNVGEEQVVSIIQSSVTESFKIVIGQYNIFDIPMNQDKIRKQVFDMVNEKVGGYPARITDFMITNYNWSDDFNKQIENTMQSAQMVKKKQQELLVTQQEAQKIVKQAEAEREALVQKATGERDAALLRAEAKQAEGDGIRKYNEAIAKNMAQEVEFRKLAIEQTKAERWNGQQVSTNNYGPIPVQTGSIVK